MSKGTFLVTYQDVTGRGFSCLR